MNDLCCCCRSLLHIMSQQCVTRVCFNGPLMLYTRKATSGPHRSLLCCAWESWFCADRLWTYSYIEFAEFVSKKEKKKCSVARSRCWLLISTFFPQHAGSFGDEHGQQVYWNTCNQYSWEENVQRTGKQVRKGWPVTHACAQVKISSWVSRTTLIFIG